MINIHKKSKKRLLHTITSVLCVAMTIRVTLAHKKLVETAERMKTDIVMNNNYCITQSQSNTSTIETLLVLFST